MTEQIKKVDWELVEKHYRAGILSNVQISKECGVTEGAIRKRAKRDQWTKNLKAKIKARAEELVRAEAVRVPGTSLTPKTEKETVEVNAKATAVILIAQKGSISRMHAVTLKLLGELELTTDNNDLFVKLGELLDTSGPDENGKWRADKLNEMYQRVISTGGRIDSAKKVAEILEKVVRLEREAFGFNDEANKSQSDVDALLTKINAATD